MEVINDNIPEDAVELDDEEISLDYLMQIIHELPDQYRIVFSLYVLDDYSHQEISEMLSITTGTTKSNLHRARLLLKEKIEKKSMTNLKTSVK
jgi:RNA polymerase sigma factor (sigma-70 family)